MHMLYISWSSILSLQIVHPSCFISNFLGTELSTAGCYRNYTFCVSVFQVQL